MRRQRRRFQILVAKYGLDNIRLGFLSVLMLCVVAFLVTLACLNPRSRHYPTPTLMEINIPKLKKGWDRVFERNLSDKWVVTVGKIGSNISRPLQQSGYTVVFVPDRYRRKDKDKCRQPDCVYLDPRTSYTLVRGVVRYLPPGSYVRRLIGYLYAISQGANVIYTRNIYNHDSRNPSCKLHSHNTYTIMEYTLDKTAVHELRSVDFNTTLSLFTVPWYIYHKYVLRHVQCGLGNKVPPTLSLSSPNMDNSSHHVSYTTVRKRPQPSMANSSHRVSHTSVRQRQQLSVKPERDFTVLDSSLASFKYVTFWSLIFHTFYGPLGKLLTDRLLREIDSAVSRPREYTDVLFDDLPWKHEENSHARTHTSEQIVRLHTILHTWKCDDGVLFYQCIRGITDRLVTEELLTDDDMTLINLWLDDLLHVGYKQPVRFKHRISETRLDKPEKSTNQSQSRRVVHSGNERPGQTTFSKYCPHLKLKTSTPVINDIALIITFNEARYYANIAMLESMYRGYFKHIIFCGPEIHSFTRESTLDVDITHFIFIEAFKPGWYFFYDCLLLAGQLNINVEGFIQIGDDTLLNPWNLKKFPRNKVWLHKGLDYLNVSLEKLTPEWSWWNHWYGKEAVLDSLNQISNEALFATKDDIFRKYLETYMNNSGNFTYIYRQGCDFMYVPRAYMKEYIKIGSVFQKNNVMVELAHATIMMGLQLVGDIVFVEDGSLWSVGERALSLLFFRESRLFLHPFKIDTVKRSKHFKHVLCNTYMNHSESHL